MNFTSTSNGYVDIHSITAEPGEDFENWIEISKQQLRERENKLMMLRISTLQSIIKTKCVNFETSNASKYPQQAITVADYDKIINNTLVSECLDRLNELLSLWNGINLHKTKQAPSTLQKYFAIAKCWFDQKKKVILAPDFWVKFFTHLEQFAAGAASRYFNDGFNSLQKLYAKHLLFQILSGIFAGELQYAGTKGQPLVASAIVKDNQAMKHYLNALHSSLNIEQLMKKDTPNSLNAKELLAALNSQLVALAEQYQAEFHREFQVVYINNSNTNNYAVSGPLPAVHVQQVSPLLTPPTMPPVHSPYSRSAPISPRGFSFSSMFPSHPPLPQSHSAPTPRKHNAAPSRPSLPQSYSAPTPRRHNHNHNNNNNPQYNSTAPQSPSHSQSQSQYSYQASPKTNRFAQTVQNMDTMNRFTHSQQYHMDTLTNEYPHCCCSCMTQRSPPQKPPQVLMPNSTHCGNRGNGALNDVSCPYDMTRMPLIEHKSSDTVIPPHDIPDFPQSSEPLEPFEPLETWGYQMDLSSPMPLVPSYSMNDVDGLQSFPYSADRGTSQSVFSQRFSPMNYSPSSMQNPHY